MVLKLRPKNRLGELMRRPGGTTVEEALAAARVNLDTMRTESIAILDTNLREMYGVVAVPRRSLDEETQLRLYTLAKEVVSLAGLFDLQDVGEAAHSLCEVLDNGRMDTATLLSSIEVHLNAMKLLRASAAQLPAEAREALLQGLRLVSGKPGADSPADNRY